MKKLIILSLLTLAVNGCAKQSSDQSKKAEASPAAKADEQRSAKSEAKLQDTVALASSGRQLSAKQAAELEAAVAKDPGDLSARTKLLGYYLVSSGTDASKTAIRAHVLWIIKNQPEAEIAGLPECGVDFIQDPDGYQQAKQLWLDQTAAQPKNATILDHAAKFFLIRDQTVALTFLDQLQQLEPNNPKWSDKLGEFYTFDRSKAGAVKALEQFEKAQAADKDNDTRFYRLDELTKTAFDAGQETKAAQFAEQLLEAAAPRKGDWNYGNAVHHANNTLGRIALRKGDAKRASEYLLKAGQTPGSPQLDSFGPNMSLAKELLEAGEKETVLQYLQLCRKFWKMGDSRLDDWTKEVQAGQVPNFGANLVY